MPWGMRTLNVCAPALPEAIGADADIRLEPPARRRIAMFMGTALL